jgi:hypothetical protein
MHTLAPAGLSSKRNPLPAPSSSPFPYPSFHSSHQQWPAAVDSACCASSAGKAADRPRSPPGTNALLLLPRLARRALLPRPIRPRHSHSRLRPSRLAARSSEPSSSRCVSFHPLAARSCGIQSARRGLVRLESRPRPIAALASLMTTCQLTCALALHFLQEYLSVDSACFLR